MLDLQQSLLSILREVLIKIEVVRNERKSFSNVNWMIHNCLSLSWLKPNDISPWSIEHNLDIHRNTIFYLIFFSSFWPVKFDLPRNFVVNWNIMIKSSCFYIESYCKIIFFSYLKSLWQCRWNWILVSIVNLSKVSHTFEADGCFVLTKYRRYPAWFVQFGVGMGNVDKCLPDIKKFELGKLRVKIFLILW